MLQTVLSQIACSARLAFGCKHFLACSECGNLIGYDKHKAAQALPVIRDALQDSVHEACFYFD